MRGQTSLLDQRPPPPWQPRPAAMLDPETSWSAGRTDTPAKQVTRSRLRAEVLALHQANPNGLTDDELARLLPDDDKGSIVKRRGDLVHAGHLEDSGRTRQTRRSCAAIVWRLVT